MKYSREFYDELFLNRDREMYIRIDLLSWDESKIKEIQGLIVSGSLSVDGNSSIRRSINLEMVLDTDTYFLPEVANEINISKKIQISVGLKNNTYYGRFPDLVSKEFSYLASPIIWFELGIFVPTEVTLSHSIESSSISLSGQDKMVLLNGDIAGELGYDVNFVRTVTNESLSYRDIIRDSVSYFGGIDKSKIIILDLPGYADTLYRMSGSLVLNTSAIPSNSFGLRTFNIDTATPYGSTGFTQSLSKGDIVGVQVPLNPKNQDSKIEMSVTDKVSDILEKIKNGLPGQFEYFFNIDGNFIFQLKKKLTDNYIESGSIQDKNPKKYYANFSTIPYIYDFTDKEIISSFSNSPNWKGIKNDFFVYGKNNLLYHIAIDSIPESPDTFYVENNGVWDPSESNRVAYSQPWQQYIIDLTDFNNSIYPGTIENKYYAELNGFFKYNEASLTGIYVKTSPISGIWRNGNNIPISVTAPISTGSFSINLSGLSQEQFDAIPSGAIVTGPGIQYGTYIQSKAASPNRIIISKTCTATNASNLISIDTNFNINNQSGNPSTWNYFFDIIDDSNESIGKFSINTIGRRIKSIKDDTIEVLYPSTSLEPTYSRKIIIFKDAEIGESNASFKEKNADAIELEYELTSKSENFISILESQIFSYLDNSDFLYKNDAFSNIKSLLYTHTAFNESVSIQSIPLYFLEPNNRINLSDSNTQIFGDHYLQSFSIPLSADGMMSMSAVKVHE